MAIDPFLAMTAAEIENNSILPSKIGWMACHFSPYGTGLSNLPRQLPESSLLILNDRTPIHGHDPERIAAQLSECIRGLHCAALLLDFQRPDCAETAALIQHLLQALSCPVVVSDVYAKALDCPVFLPPVPPSAGLGTHISLWEGRDIWLEIGLDGEELRLTEEGCTATSLPHFSPPEEGHRDERLHCRYHIGMGEDIRFTLWRTLEDLQALMAEAEKLGISNFVGLYQELEQLPG